MNFNNFFLNKYIFSLNSTLRTRDTFDQTPVMSTYLVAFIVSEFQMRSNANDSFRVIARPDAFEQTIYAHEVGAKLLEQMETYLNYSYSNMTAMTKMDMAALPDFSAGAMENWGLLTFRETALLYDANVSTSLAQQRVATVITHEQVCVLKYMYKTINFTILYLCICIIDSYVVW